MILHAVVGDREPFATSVSDQIQLTQEWESKKSNLRYTPFRVSRLSGVHLRGFEPEPTLQRLQRWRVVGNVWKI